jgi:transcriptional regulator with GAF, ATPase, and Fis domain
MVKKGEYRNDLFYRLNVFPIEIPPLRERLDEIEALTLSFLNNMNLQNKKKIEKIHPLVLEAFQCYHWPGNIRELQNLVERAFILETANCLTPESFPAELFENEVSSVLHVPLTTGMTIADVRKKTLDNIERQYLKELLLYNKGRINLSAQTAGVSPRQIHKLMKKYEINKNDFK